MYGEGPGETARLTLGWCGGLELEPYKGNNKEPQQDRNLRVTFPGIWLLHPGPTVP